MWGLLEIIAAHISPSSGTVKIFGDDAFKSSSEVRRKFPQSSAAHLFPLILVSHTLNPHSAL
ncbi:MAG: hypothetical protein WBE22_09405 [Halobacteriota archaeon]